MSVRFSGSGSNFWKGGVSKPNELQRKNAAYRAWRTAVFERDDYTCQICGQRGGKLQADHILRFAEYPDRRLDVANGRTLCLSCHLATPTYGNRQMATA